MSSNEVEVKHEGRHCCHGRRIWKFPFIVLIFVAIKSALVLLIWNAMMPELFHLPSLHYFQAVGLVILARLLVGFSPGHGPHHHFAKHHWRAHHHWAHLTPEEREKLREEIAKRCSN